MRNVDCAICPNSTKCLIFDTDRGNEDFAEWELRWTLSEHDLKISGIDWAPKKNLILTCSEDRTAYVWNLDPVDDEWKPVIVLLRLTRSALCCKWSPNENKFAIGSSGKTVSVCYFSEDQNWWISRILRRRFKSSVVSVCWHPQNNQILASASTDGYVRVHGVYVRKVDGTDPSKTKKRFGSVLWEFSCGSWVHDVHFSPSGEQLCFVTHNSSVFISRFNESLNFSQPQRIRTKHLPFKSCLFLNDFQIVCAGWSYSPILYEFKAEEEEWKEKSNLDEEILKKEIDGKGNEKNPFKPAWNINYSDTSFRSDKKMVPMKSTRHTKLVNGISLLRNYKSSTDQEDGKVSFSTSSIDGRIFQWKI